MRKLLWLCLFRVATADPIDLKLLSSRSPSGLVCCTVWCSHCASCRKVEPELLRLYRDMQGKVTVVAIDANDNDDTQSIAAYALPMPVLMDPRGGLADSYKIDVTTTTLIFDSQQSLCYFGQFQGARKALQELLDKRPVTTPVTPLEGCTIIRHR